VARIFSLFLLLSLTLPVAAPWAPVVAQDDLLGIKAPPPGFVDVVGIPDFRKIPAGAFPPKGMTVVDWAIGDPGGFMIVRRRVPAERALGAQELMLDPAAFENPAK
jgi:hypothetical protein